MRGSWAALVCIGCWAASALRIETEDASASQLGRDKDIVMVSVNLDCIAKFSIQQLQKHVPHRKLYFISKGEICADPFFAERHEESPNNIVCIDEDKAVEGLSFSVIKNTLTQLDEKYKSELVPRTGWYLQQFLKLVYPLSNPDISDDFLVFDADMFPTKPLTLYHDNKPAVKSGGTPGPWHKDYRVAYEYLSGGMHLKFPGAHDPHDQSTFVIHHALFRKPWVEEMLAQFALKAPAFWEATPEMQTLPKFAQAVLQWAASSNVTQGFSEYAYYASWVQEKHASEIVMLTKDKGGPHGPTRHKRLQYCEQLGEEEDCCPAEHMFVTDSECFLSEISGFESHKNENSGQGKKEENQEDFLHLAGRKIKSLFGRPRCLK